MQPSHKKPHNARSLPNATTTENRGEAGQWLHIFWVGLVLWALSVVVTALTGNPALLPTVVLLGSFLVPVSFVTWLSGKGSAEVTLGRVVEGFVVGGVLGVLAASLLETYLLSPSVWMYLGVGLIEELVKVLALMYVARGMAHRTLRGGLLLGATVGFGFAAFESAGYALNALITRHGLSLWQVVETEILRGILAPVGHGLWTAILGGVLFAATRAGRWRLTGGVVLAYLGVAVLHALWDSMRGIALVLVVVLTETRGQRAALELGYVPRPTDQQAHLFTVFNGAGLIIVSVLGLLWLAALRNRLPDPEPAHVPTGR
ncbi:PrsW family intramembrane metalloprotease [Saccharopolyspora indica]|uniref:PrsW family intramembrane metalloprotease n=1 Tax=Saccharopolyspora indica TaxID=1229659 RepID=UPI0022EACB51|nr:PrsW family glutamic-type intramembrane protease [Saccharopolyspora indica]MDA3648736.1 PrsW family glutamic-type intramembrane protease [Saccharopolyspora indica]